jgi:hypothetical protein
VYIHAVQFKWRIFFDVVRINFLFESVDKFIGVFFSHSVFGPIVISRIRPTLHFVRTPEQISANLILEALFLTNSMGWNVYHGSHLSRSRRHSETCGRELRIHNSLNSVSISLI